MGTRSGELTTNETVPYDDRDRAVVERRSFAASMPVWSPAQIVALIVGIGFGVLGIAAVARTGFDTSHIYLPHERVMGFAHSPLLGAIEIGFGVLMVIAAVAPGGMRGFMGFLGAVALAFGIVVLFEAQPNRLNDWLAVTHGSGWLFVVVGAVVVLTALFSPVFGGNVQRRSVRREHVAG